MESRATSATMQYLAQTFVKKDFFAEIRRLGESLCPGMQLSPYEAYLLHWLVRVSGATRILEIGSFIGYSSRWLAQALPPDGKVITLEKHPEHAELARTHTHDDPRIQVITADAIPWLNSYTGASFDYLFMDGQKRRYNEYLDAALPHLAPQAWIVADNTLLFGALAGEGKKSVPEATLAAMEKFNMRLADPQYYDSSLLPTEEGLTVARRRLK
jgi:predicted O-methyltransferase YrrM